MTMKRYIVIPAAAMAACLVSCSRVMDLTPPQEEPMDTGRIEFSLYETGSYDYYLDNPSYDYSILIGKNYAEQAATARFIVRDAADFGDEYTLLPEGNWSLSSEAVEFKETDTVHEVELSFTDLTSLDPSRKYVLGLELSSDEIAVSSDRKSLTFYIYQEQGGEGNPIIITTPDDLAGIEGRLKAGQTTYFRLGADINMAGVAWTPVNTTQQKQIDFDGCGYTISNLSMTTAVNGNLGFFSFLRGRFANVNFKDVSVTGDNITRAGTVAGQAGEDAYPAVIENVTVTGTIDAGSTTNQHTGGICSTMEGNSSRISRCSVDADIKAYWSAAGICGYLAVGAKVSECRFSGNITTGSRAGGIVGQMKFGTVENCHSSGTLDSGGTTSITGNPGPNGGIVAYTTPPADHNKPALISYCYSECSQTTRNQVGGILGYTGENVVGLTSIENCIAWNDFLKSLSAPKSGRISGRFMVGTAVGCWANPDMKWEISGNTNIGIDEGNITTPTTSNAGQSKGYNGTAATGTLIETAKDVVGFDLEIWDMSGERPVLKWEVE